MELKPDFPRLEFQRGSADYTKIFFVYLLLVPMLLCIASAVLGFTLMWIGDMLRSGGGLAVPVGALGFAAPWIWAVIAGVRSYRRWSVERIAIEADRLEIFRKGKSWILRFEDITLLSFNLGKVVLRSRSGPPLSLGDPTWPTYEIKQALKERAVSRMREAFLARIRSGATLCFRTQTRIAVYYLICGIMTGVIGATFGINCLGRQLPLVYATYMGFGSVILLSLGVELLRRFALNYWHRVEVDGQGLRLFNVPRWRAVSWTQVTLLTHGEDGALIGIDGGDTRLRVNKEIDNYEVLFGVIQGLANIG